MQEIDWNGKSTAGSTIIWREDLHDILNRTGILQNLKYNQYFEIDSKCPNSTMVPQVVEKIGNDSLLNRGTWAFLGSSTDANKRYLFWTSVDTKAVGADQQIPVIVSRASGGYYISQTTTAARVSSSKKYVAIADHIGDYSKYTKGKEYTTLEEAYEAYKKQVNDNPEFKQYKNTLPE